MYVSCAQVTSRFTEVDSKLRGGLRKNDLQNRKAAIVDTYYKYQYQH
jgi:hypothetical protein